MGDRRNRFLQIGEAQDLPAKQMKQDYKLPSSFQKPKCGFEVGCGGGGSVALRQPAYELWFMPNDQQNATEIKHVARLNTFNVGADGSGRERQLNAEGRKPALRVRRLRTL